MNTLDLSNVNTNYSGSNRMLWDTARSHKEKALSHTELEQIIQKPFINSPDYAIANVEGYDTIKLFTSLFSFNDQNNLWQRSKRFLNEKLYVVDSVWFDKIATLCLIISLIIAIIILYSSWELDVHSEYVFNNPNNASDLNKQTKLNLYNKWNGMPLLITKTIIIIVPALITLWRIFKRTTDQKINSTPIPSYKYLARRHSQEVNNSKISPGL